MPPGVVGHGTLGHLDMAARHAECREQAGLHRGRIVLAKRPCGDPTQQGEAGIGIAAHYTRCSRGLPVAKVVQRRSVVAFQRVRKLQRQVTRREACQLQHRGLVDCCALQGRKVAARVGVQRQLAQTGRVGGQRGGQHLGDRAHLEKRVVGHRLLAPPGHDAVVEDIGAPVHRDGDRHAGNVMLRHQRADGCVHGGADAGLVEGLGRRGAQAEGQGEERGERLKDPAMHR
mmetsp:Transcript_44277/g.104016  ORF Transcript_44277/g.104016 Transcript_44277/m.104016 type:complete len:230 (-) Transcript_44277:152-841(-)